MKKLVLYPGNAVIALLLAVTMNPSDNPAPQQAQPKTVIRSNTRLVVLDIVATDNSGAPVTGLKESDFTILENGEAQRIDSFSFQHAAPAVEAPAPALPANVITNVPRRSSGSLNVILLDRLNGESRNQSYAQDRLIKFLDNSSALQPTAIFVLDQKLTLVHDFTTDTKALRGALNNVRSSGAVRVVQANVAASPFGTRGDFHTSENGIEGTLRALKLLSKTLAGYPGRKNLIWVSEAFPVSLTIEGVPDRTSANTLIIARSVPGRGQGNLIQGTKDPTTVDTPVNTQSPLDDQTATGSPDIVVAGSGHTYAEEMAKITDSLMDAHVSLYPVDAAGIGQADRLSAQNNMKEMAERTGGRAFYNRNDIETSVASSVNDGSTFYSVAYYPGNRSWDGHFRRIEVKSSRPDIHLHYRNGYYALDPESVARQDSSDLVEEFSRAMDFGSPDFTSLHFQASVLPPAGGTRQVTVNFAIDPRFIAFEHQENGRENATVSCSVAVYREKGDQVRDNRPEVKTMTASLTPDEYQKVMKQYFPCQRTLDLKPGRYLLRLGAVDRTSHMIGTISTSLTVN